MSEKKWVIEQKRCADEFDVSEPEWREYDSYTTQEEAEADWATQTDLYGHNTYFRLVKIKRTILKEC